MTDTRYKIVFTGELMPTATLDAVKDNLARLFKSDRDKIDGLFTGNPVALKRDLTDAEADKYVGALQNAGAKVYKEKDLASSLSLVETDDHHTAAVEPDENVRMTCPKCGHEQAQGIECSACGIVIEKYLARQAQLAEAGATEPAPAAAAAVASPYATPQAQVGDVMPEYGELNYFTVEGRIGRVRYLGWSMAMTLLAIPIMGVFAGISALSSIFGGLLVILAVIAMVVVGVFIGAKRLHDIGWSAWLWLLLLVPAVGSVFAIIMLVVPGTPGPNRYGPPPPPNSKGVVVLAWTMLLVPIIGILAAIALPAYQGYVQQAEESSYSEPAVDSAEPSVDMAEPAEAVEPAEPGEPADEAESSQE
ncbi:DUF805 domain-containing protein [Pseudomonas turukhanskensis]|uniref:Methionyl/Leucyl tRNA synthetase domain-containing protein n=1 Tax=Pseudomonas turukhanskensis TaxID=1806536 RepID=A0A9W6NHC9_9PSED|nr:DUF805 domain-containing protein [Pseudomonas turukhanskensis]GLK90988.1 hypothetical protein GCM10017655_40520 [Pseudomonas turukhanskensis]